MFKDYIALAQNEPISSHLLLRHNQIKNAPNVTNSAHQRCLSHGKPTAGIAQAERNPNEPTSPFKSRHVIAPLRVSKGPGSCTTALVVWSKDKNMLVD